MIRIALIALGVAALVWFLSFDRAHQQTVNAQQSRCDAYASAGVDCPYAIDK